MNSSLLVLPIILLAGCSANSLMSKAKNVRVTNNEPSHECKYLGEVTGSQGNFITGKWTSNSNLEKGAYNDLKNEAADLGGNVVVIITQRATQTSSTYEGSGTSQETGVILTGNVYSCPD